MTGIERTRRHIGMSLAYVAAVRQWMSGAQDAALDTIRDDVQRAYDPGAVAAVSVMLSRHCVAAGAAPDAEPEGFSKEAVLATSYYLGAFANQTQETASRAVWQDFAMVHAGDPCFAVELLRCLLTRLADAVPASGPDTMDETLTRMEAHAVRLGQTLRGEK